MCLSEITKVYKRPIKRRFYKVMEKSGKNMMQFPYRSTSHHDYRKVVIGQDIAAIGETIGYGKYYWKPVGDYKSGFHGFRSLKDARLYRQVNFYRRGIVLVLCEGAVHTTGVEPLEGGKADIYVAESMKILKVVE